MKMKLELVPVPVADVDRAKVFYVEQVGFAAYQNTPCESSNSKTCPSGSCSVKVYSPHGFWLGAPSTGKPTSCKCWYNPSTSDVPNSTCVAPYFKSPTIPLPAESRANSPGRCTISSTPGIIL